MRFGSLATITAGLLGFAGQVLGVVYGNEVTRHVAITKSKFIEDWDKNGRKCLERARRGGPLLFPPEFDLDKQHQDLFKNIIEHILEIHDEIERDGFRHLAATKDSTRQWKKIYQCLPHYQLIRVEEMTDSFAAIRDLGKKLRKLRWRNGDAATALGDDLLVHLLRLIGFLNNLYSTTEVPMWLVDSPGQAIGSMISYLSFDVSNPHGCTLADSPYVPPSNVETI